MERIEKLKQYILENPTDSFLQHALALEYVKIQNDTEARKLFENLLAQNPGYVGSYYHLGKLLERADAIEEAVEWYEKGMVVAKQAGDQHAYNEIQASWEDLTE